MIGKITDYGIKLTQAGLPQVAIKFDIAELGGSMTWYGSLKEGKAREITLATLVRCGFKGNDLSLLTNNISGGALNASQEYDLTIADEVDQKGQPRKKIRWVNLPGENKFEGIEPSEAKDILKGMDLSGDLAHARSKVKLPVAPVQKTGTDGDVPF